MFNAFGGQNEGIVLEEQGTLFSHTNVIVFHAHVTVLVGVGLCGGFQSNLEGKREWLKPFSINFQVIIDFPAF